MSEIKKVLINPFKRQPETNRVASAPRNLLTQFDSSEDKNKEPPRKSKRTELANIWLEDEEEQEGRPLDATPRKSSKKKENKGKGRGNF